MMEFTTTSTLPAEAMATAETVDTSIGEIVAISGSEVTVLLDEHPNADQHAMDACPHIGTLLTIDTGRSVSLCLIKAMSVPEASVGANHTLDRRLQVELVGELPREEDGYLRTFCRGVSVYPRLGDRVQPASRKVLEKAYYFGNRDAVEIGRIHQDQSIPAVIKLDDMMGKHFAVVGSTGSGKSCTVALILREVLAKHPNAHVVLLDPHNEYGASFGEKAEIVGLDNLSLPFWFLTFDEVTEILVGNVAGRNEEIEILRDLIPVAKRQFAANSRKENRLAQRAAGRQDKLSIDTPVPYRLSDLLGLLDARMGRLDVQKDLSPYKRLKAHIEQVTQDPRYAFMFGNLTVQDNLASVLKRLFRIPVAGRPITVIQLIGLPAEIVNVVVSVLARLAFDLALWSDGRMPITFVCEEAHRYVPCAENSGFEPAKRAISQIAKEGRKYGISLCVVTQRPGDIDPTILSQCSTLFAMRLTNERDQRIVETAVSDAAESLLKFLPSLGNRETIVFGEGVALPSRILLNMIPPEALPKGTATPFSEAWANDISDDSFVDDVVERWRTTGRTEEGTAAVSPDRQAEGNMTPSGYAPQGMPVAAPNEGLRIEPAGMQFKQSPAAPAPAAQPAAAPPQFSNERPAAPPLFSSERVAAPPQFPGEHPAAPPQFAGERRVAPPQFSSEQPVAPPHFPGERPAAPSPEVRADDGPMRRAGDNLADRMRRLTT